MTKKRFGLLLVCLIIALAAVIPSQAAPAAFVDISGLPCQTAVEELHELGIVNTSPDRRFRPADPLTRAEAAALLGRAFKLSPIKSMVVSEPIAKKLTYSDSLQQIDESFAVASAPDIVGHWGFEEIEGLLKVRAAGLVDGQFNPEGALSKREFVVMMAKVIFGVDENTDYSANYSALGLDMGLWEKEDVITRADAATLVHEIVTAPGFKTITLLVTTDIHGHIEPFLPGTSKYAIGGMSRMSRFVADVRGRQPNTILLDVGDAPYNTNVTNLFEGAPVIQIMNHMHYDAMCLGNHDFDFPQSVMERNAAAAEFPFLSANTYRDGAYPSYLKPHIMLEVDGIKFAVIGLTDDQSAVYTHPNNTVGLTFKDHFATAGEQVAEVRDQADIVIALAHLHGDNMALPLKVDGIDIELAGGTDIVAMPQKVGNTWVISSGKHSELVSQMNLNFMGKELIGFNFGHVFMTQNLPEDEFVSDVVEEYTAELNAKMADVVGQTMTHLDGERGTVRMKESNLGNLVADSLRDITGADIALQNGGGIRDSIKVGPITLKDIYTVLPFDNRVVMIEATGRTLWEALENGVSSYPGAAGSFLQVSGVEYTFDAALEPGKRVISVTIGGKPIDLDRTYKVVANDFLTGGGDHYDMLKNCRVLLDTKLYLRDALKEYVAKVGTVAPTLEGRITVINPENK